MRCAYEGLDGQLCGGRVVTRGDDPDVSDCLDCGETYHRSPASRITLPAPGYMATLARDMMDVRDPRDP